MDLPLCTVMLEHVLVSILTKGVHNATAYNLYSCTLAIFPVKLHVTHMSTLLSVAVKSNGKWPCVNAFFAYLSCAFSIRCLCPLSYTLIFCVRPHPVCMHLCTSPQKKGWKGNGRGRAREWSEGVGVYEDVDICPRSPGLTCFCNWKGWAEHRGKRKPGMEGRG